MRFTIHYDDTGDGGPGPRWWRYVVLAGVLIVLIGLLSVLVIVARAM